MFAPIFLHIHNGREKATMEIHSDKLTPEMLVKAVKKCGVISNREFRSNEHHIREAARRLIKNAGKEFRPEKDICDPMSHKTNYTCTVPFELGEKKNVHIDVFVSVPVKAVLDD
jgi:hypothetical protein